MLRNNIGWFKNHHQNTWSLIFKYPKGFYRLGFFPASKMVIYNTELTYFPDLSFSENQFWDQIQPLTRFSLEKLNYSFFSRNLVRCFPYKYLTSLVQKRTQETQKNEEKLHSKHHLCAGPGNDARALAGARDITRANQKKEAWTGDEKPALK